MEDERFALDLETARRFKKWDIERYDVSEKVNSFGLSFGGRSISYWLPAQKRGQLVTSVTAWKNGGHETYRLDLREYGTHVDIGCDKLLEMLAALEEYAVGCYNATSANLAAVDRLETAEEVEGFDVSAGYPERMEFEV